MRSVLFSCDFQIACVVIPVLTQDFEGKVINACILLPRRRTEPYDLPVPDALKNLVDEILPGFKIVTKT